MRVKNLFWSLAGAMALSACSSENTLFDEVNEENPKVINGESRYMAVQIMNPTSLTKAADDDYEKKGYEKGIASENNIKSLRFYFFDNDGEAVIVNNGVNYVNAPVGKNDGEEAPNVELKLEAVLVINTQAGDNANVNTMLAVANYDKAGLEDNTSLSLTELKERIGTYNASTADEFLMTSSSYIGNGVPVTVTTIKPENLCTSEEKAKESPVKVYIERLVAKTRVKTDWDESMDTKKEVSYNGNTYDAVALKDKENKSITVDGKQIYVIFTGWNVTGTADKSYLIKNVNTWELGWAWNHADAFRSYWAMNPNGLTLDRISYNDANLSVNNGAAYCFENAADDFNNGTKSSYDPAETTSNRTQALIAAVLVTVEDNVATPVSLAKWAGADYTEEGVKTAMLSQVTSMIYYETTEGEPSAENPRTFASIKLDQVELVSGIDAGIANQDTEDSKRYLSYLKLVAAEDENKVQFYKASVNQANTDKEIEENQYTDEEVNKILANIPGAKVWKNGMTYYYTDLKHLGTDDTKGKYGVVRNHIYDVNINSVKGLGTPVYKSDEVIIPQKPKDDETYIAAQINVLSWRVVPNNTSLEW